MQDQFRSQHPQRRRRPWPAPGHWQGAHRLLALLLMFAGAFVAGARPASAAVAPPAYLGQWGGGGSGNGQFDNPTGVAVDSNGNVYVADSFNNRIQKFDSNGAYLTWDSDGEFSTPRGVAVDSNGNVYVADSYNNRIRTFRSDGTSLAQWGSSGSDPGQFDNPTGVAVDSNGNVYVADTNNNRIQKFASDGTYDIQWNEGAAQFNNPTGVAVDSNGNVYVADTNNNLIQKFASDGAFLIAWSGSDAGQFNEPRGVAVDSNGNVYVADTYNYSIQQFDSNGTYLTQWGSHGGGAGQFSLPFGVAVDSNGNVYVADTFNSRIQKFGTATSTPEIDVQGNSVSIAKGDTTPSTADHTDFGSVAVSSGSVVRTFTISNSGTGALTLSGSPLVSVTGNSAFSVSSQPASSSVAAGGTTTFQVTFDPSAAGVVTATVSIANDDTDENPYTFVVSGSGTAAPEIDVQGNGVSILNGDTTPSTADHTDFGRLDANGGSVVRTFTIGNSGTGALTLSGSPLVSVTSNSAFTVSSQPASSSVAAGGSTTFEVTFAPSAAGVVTATVSIANDDSDENPYTFVVQGIRTGGNVALGKPASQSSINGGACAVAASAVDGNTSGAWSNCSVSHTDNNYQAWWQVDLQAPYLIDVVDIWNRTDCCGERLSNFDLLVSTDGTNWTSFYYPGQAPTTTSFVVNRVARYVKVQLRGSNFLALAEVQVWGPALPDLDVQGNGVSIANGDSTPSAADHTRFQTAVDGNVVRTFTIRNVGANALSLSGNPLVSVTGNSAFSVSSQPASSSVAAGGTTTFQVTFAPSAVGVVTATVSIASNDPDENPYTFVVQGIRLGSNIAVGKPASQSSTYADACAVAAKAVDGNTDGNWSSCSIAHTNNDNQAWWQVDLQAPYLIDMVDIWNRTDGGGGLSNFDLLVSTDGTTWTTFYYPGQASTTTSFVVNQVARYVKVQLRGTNYLALAEVQVWGPAMTDLDVQGNSVSIANGDSSPSAADHTNFGRIDANGGSVVRTFTIRNVGTGALTLSGSPLVSVTGNSAFSVSSQPASSSVAGGGSTTFAVTFAPSTAGMVTATVSIASNDPDENPYTFVVQGIRLGGNVALGQPASQSSTYADACAVAAKAVDGNTDGNWSSCSIAHTNNDNQAWWQVDLQAPYLIDMVDIWSRTDGGGGLSNFDLLVSTDGTTWTNFYYPGQASTTTSFVVNQVARYVKVQLRGTNYLALAEVQVWGPALSEIDVQGTGVSIANGDTTPSTADHTDFGSVAVSSGSVVRTFTISNPGTGALTLSGSPLVSVTGNSAFSVSTQPASSSVAAGGSLPFTVTFAPSSAGFVTATVSIVNDDSDETPYTFVVGGTGSVANAQLNGVACDLIDAITAANSDAENGSCPAGSGADTITLTADVTLTVVNNSDGGYGDNGLPQIVSDITIEGADHTISRAAGAPPFRLFSAESGSTLTLNRLTLSNGNMDNGGAIFNEGMVLVSNSTLSGNTGAGDGGAIFNYGTVTVSNSTLSGNSAGYNGGAIFNYGTVTVSNSTLSSNSAGNLGGAIVNASMATVSNSTFSGNGAGNVGGAIFNNGMATVSNSTFSGNGADNLGGAVYNSADQTITLVGSLLSGNSAPDGTELYNDPGDPGNEIPGGTVDSSHNLFGYSNNAGTANFTPGATDIVPSAALTTILNATLADNGGPTWTHALVTCSPALDAAGDSGLDTDQRGITRPQGSADDIGAFEREGVGCAAPEIDVQGNGVSIATGDTTPSTADHTDFGSVAVSNAVTHTFTISNPGGADLTGVAVSVNGANAFTVVSQPAATVGAGLTTGFALRFAPTVSGTLTATVSIASNDSNENPYTFVVQGAAAAQLNNTNQVSQQSFSALYNPVVQPCGTELLPTHTLTPTLVNNAADSYHGLYFVVTELRYTAVPTYTPTLCNADGGQGGAVGAQLTLANATLGDSVLTPAESFAQPFAVGLPVRARYRLFVNLYGIPNTVTAAAAGELVGTLGWEVDENGNLVDSRVQLFLPLVAR